MTMQNKPTGGLLGGLWLRTIGLLAKVNERDQFGGTPLHSAASEGNTDLVEAFIKIGADINAQDNSGSTPLHSVANAKIAQALVSAGANVNALDKNGATPLKIAMGRNQEDVVKVLIDAGAK